LLFMSVKYHCRKLRATAVFLSCLAFSAFTQAGFNIGPLLPGEKITTPSMPPSIVSQFGSFAYVTENQ
jgi:hypothetical protein